MKNQLLFALAIATSINSNAQLPSYVPSNGLTAWYSLDGTATDASGNSNHGIVHGAIPTTDRFMNSNAAFDFNNAATISDSISLNAHAANFVHTEFTVSGWIRCSESAATWQTMLANWGPQGSNVGDRGYWVGVNQSKACLYTASASGESIIQSSFNVTNGEWHMLTATFEASGLATLYVGDSVVASSTVLYDPLISPTCIGNDFLGEWFRGQLDDIGIWNRKLSLCEISNLYTAVLSQGFDTRTECNSYTWIDGINYTSSNDTATFNIVGGAVNGCDSLVTLDLTINNVSDLTTSVSGATITANNTAATYQWLDCGNNNEIITGETFQLFTPTINGNYSVQLTENGCLDTSACLAITSVSVIENSFANMLMMYPNPTSGNFSIDLGASYESSRVTITDVTGKLIYSRTINQSKVINLSIDVPKGIYVVEVEAGDKKSIVRLVKE